MVSSQSVFKSRTFWPRWTQAAGTYFPAGWGRYKFNMSVLI